MSASTRSLAALAVTPSSWTGVAWLLVSGATCRAHQRLAMGECSSGGRTLARSISGPVGLRFRRRRPSARVIPAIPSFSTARSGFPTATTSGVAFPAIYGGPPTAARTGSSLAPPHHMRPTPGSRCWASTCTPFGTRYGVLRTAFTGRRCRPAPPSKLCRTSTISGPLCSGTACGSWPRTQFGQAKTGLCGPGKLICRSVRVSTTR